MHPNYVNALDSGVTSPRLYSGNELSFKIFETEKDKHVIGKV